MKTQGMAERNWSEAERVGIMWLKTRLAATRAIKHYRRQRRMAADRALEWRRELARRQEKESPADLVAHAATNMVNWEAQAGIWDEALAILREHLKIARP